MFSLFSKKEKTIPTQQSLVEVDVMAEELPKSKNEIILEIHNSYDNAHKDIVDWANDILLNCETEDINKGERLSKLGFLNSSKAKLAEQAIKDKQEAKTKAQLIEYYSIHYPNQKFITKDLVEVINKKYGLICVTADCYKMDIPEKNLSEIENFKVKNEDDFVFVLELSDNKWDETFNFLSKEEVINKKKDYRGYNIIKEDKEPFYISCPPSEAIIKRGFSVKNTFVTKDEIEDPIVLQPVRGGFLIVSKWGLEANDPMLVNENLN